MDDAKRDRLSRLWAEHLSAPFPSRLRGRDIGGVDLVMLDADVAGCVNSLLSVASRDQPRKAILGRCVRNLQMMLPRLAEDDAVAYYIRLRDMAELALTLAG